MFIKNTIKSLLMTSLLVSSITITPEIKASESNEGAIIAVAVVVTIVSSIAICYTAVKATLAPSCGQKQNELLTKFNNQEINFHDLKVKIRETFFYYKFLKYINPTACAYNYPIQEMRYDAKVNSVLLLAMGKTLKNEQYLKLSQELDANIQKLDENKKFVKDQKKYSKEKRDENFQQALLNSSHNYGHR